MAPKMEHLPHQEADLVAKPSSPEAEKILRNSLYLTFNAPQVDDYVSSPTKPTFYLLAPQLCCSATPHTKVLRLY